LSVYQCSLVKVLKNLRHFHLNKSNCKFEEIKTFRYLCEAQNPKLISSINNHEISEVQGQHLEGKFNDDVKFFKSNNKIVNFFPRGLTKYFKNVEEFEISYANLQIITV
jgi:hypothetical protein